MNTLVFYILVSMVVLGIASVIPGVQHLVRPIVDLFFKLIQAIASTSVYWAIYVAKNLVDAHVEFVRHLMLDAKDLDPTLAMRENE